MTSSIFVTNIEAILEDGTEVSNVSGFVIDNKRVFKLNDGTVLTGTKKIKNIKSSLLVVPADILPYINNMENE
tara:strand:+ start:364 stop:582 length:219 start_codon:yes stop_codon:yes gene_type:complete